MRFMLLANMTVARSATGYGRSSFHVRRPGTSPAARYARITTAAPAARVPTRDCDCGRRVLDLRERRERDAAQQLVGRERVTALPALLQGTGPFTKIGLDNPRTATAQQVGSNCTANGSLHIVGPRLRESMLMFAIIDTATQLSGAVTLHARPIPGLVSVE